jgi:hypothetical protein
MGRQDGRELRCERRVKDKRSGKNCQLPEPPIAEQLERAHDPTAV